MLYIAFYVSAYVLARDSILYGDRMCVRFMYVNIWVIWIFDFEARDGPVFFSFFKKRETSERERGADTKFIKTHWGWIRRTDADKNETVMGLTFIFRRYIDWDLIFFFMCFCLLSCCFGRIASFHLRSCRFFNSMPRTEDVCRVSSLCCFSSIFCLVNDSVRW